MKLVDLKTRSSRNQYIEKAEDERSVFICCFKDDTKNQIESWTIWTIMDNCGQIWTNKTKQKWTYFFD